MSSLSDLSALYRILFQLKEFKYWSVGSSELSARRYRGQLRALLTVVDHLVLRDAILIALQNRL